MNDACILAMVAISAITGLEAIALFMGMAETTLLPVVSLLAGLGGFVVGRATAPQI